MHRWTITFGSLIAVAALFGAALASPAAGPPAPAAQPVPQQAAPVAPPVIPIPEIAQRAEEVKTLLQQSSARLAADARVNEIEGQLPDASEWIRVRLVVTTETLNASPSATGLTTLSDSWSLMRERLTEWNQTLTRRATELDREVAQLEALRLTWSASRDEALTSRAPAPVLERINATLAAIVAARDAVGAWQARVLRLQDRVVKEAARCDAILANIRQTHDELVGGVFTRNSVPIWSAEARTHEADVGPRLRRSLADTVHLVEQYFAGQLGRVPFHVALFIIILILVGRARIRARQRRGADTTDHAIAEVLDAPLSSALALSLLATVWIYPRVPASVNSAVGLLILPPVVVILRRLAPPRLRPALYALAAFFVVDRAREVCAVVPTVEQWVFLIEMLVGIAFLASAARAEHRVLAWVLWVQLVMLAVAVFAGTLGYVRLARLLGTAVLNSDYAGLVLYAGVRVGAGLLAHLLDVRPLATLGMVARHRQLLHVRLGRALQLLAIGTWTYLTLDGLGVAGAIGSATGAALNARYVRGSVSLSLGDVLAFGLTIVAAYLVSAFVRFVLQEDVYPRTGLPRGASYALSTLLHYVLIFLGVLFAVAALGVDLTRITILAGAFGVGIGIGLQNVVANFVAGVILLLEQRIHVGDAVEAGDLRGEVREIGFRASTVRTATGGDVIVPNSRLTSERVTNWTLSDRNCRIDLNVTVAYTAEMATVLDVLRKTAAADPAILAVPGPVAICTGFRDNGLGFELRVWAARVEAADGVRSELAMALHAALVAARIEIAPPPR
ncbi:MAG TPA: mechanosensitive ion channel domain-containing protein [Gaiellales bacterium]|nr:mechanosensitive ion channel domain-containing protein [Gaiellales bacterium]